MAQKARFSVQDPEKFYEVVKKLGNSYSIHVARKRLVSHHTELVLDAESLKDFDI